VKRKMSELGAGKACPRNRSSLRNDCFTLLINFCWITYAGRTELAYHIFHRSVIRGEN
jgi:hypothetical protein